MSEIQYGKYIEEECCEDCGYAGGYQNMSSRFPRCEPIVVCPDCGGDLITAVGRWVYTESKPWWFGITTTKYIRFEKGRMPSDQHKSKKDYINPGVEY